MSGLARSRMMLVRTSPPAIEAWSSSCPCRSRNGGCAARLPLRRPTEGSSRPRLEEADGTCIWRCGSPTGHLVHVAPGKRQDQVRSCLEARRLAQFPPEKSFRRVPSLPYFPSSPSVTRSVLIPRPAARRVSASPLRAPCGFRLSENLCCKEQKRKKDFPNLPKKRRLALGSGAHSRRFAQECPEGNPGKYRQEK